MVDKLINNNFACDIEEFAFFAFSPIVSHTSKIIDIVHHLIQGDYVENKIKEEHYTMLISGVSWAIYHRPFDVLAQLAIDYKKGSASKKTLIKQILNHESVTKKYANCFMHANPNRGISHIVDVLPEVYNKETILRILYGNIKNKLFLIFGCHPVLLNHVDLQAKWINYFVKYPLVSRCLNRFYVSGEALDAVPVEIAFEFIKHIARRGDSSLKQLDKNTVKRVVALYVTAYGKVEKLNIEIY